MAHPAGIKAAVNELTQVVIRAVYNRFEFLASIVRTAYTYNQFIRYYKFIVSIQWSTIHTRIQKKPNAAKKTAVREGNL